MTNTQKTEFLNKLGYVIETINYKVHHDGGRSSEDWITEHSITVAYKEPFQDIEEFKKIEFHTKEVSSWDYIGKIKMEEVFKKEFNNHLFHLVMNNI